MNRILLIAVFLALIPASVLAQTLDSAMVERIARADANNDGAVTRSEFLNFRNTQFQRIDRNRDGYLSHADAPRFGARSVSGVDVPAMIEQFDTNSDDRVSRAELSSGPTPAFDLADQNRDQVVTQAERRAAVAAARR